MKPNSSVLVRIREMVLQGELKPGERVPEAAIALRLGISRTPVRQALPVLAEEGLLVEAGARGFSVRAFSIAEITEAVEVRGALEGLAARAIAERGVSRGLVRILRDCLEEGDEIFAKRSLVATDEARYSEMNGRFHATIVEACEQSIVQEVLARVGRIPFVAPGAIAFDRFNLEQMYDALWYAHRQHHAITQAIENGEGARAEALFREHVNTQKHSMNLRRAAPLPREAEMFEKAATP